ncbi:MAG TPA: hypothetical protein VKS25_06610 [Solirubrobacteraceae bacterium]|nr:hypothetical protein [Solirubrobacteraceae bacterium]
MTARDLAVWAAAATAAVNGLTGLFGAFRWYIGAPSREFWVALRGGQVLTLAYALLVGGLVIASKPPASNLFYVYALVPIAVGFVAEQLRVVAADHVLSARDLDSSAEVAGLPAAEQEAIVLVILRREMGIMALAAIVVCVLALRAAGTY